jgi:hypothetical protein
MQVVSSSEETAMPKQVLISAALIALPVLLAAACRSEPEFAGDSEVLNAVSEPAEPSEQTLCEIVYGQSTRQEIEQILGPGYRRETSARIALWYEYPSGLGLSLSFREDDVFEDATVYNGAYPDCWADEERMQTAELQARAKMQSEQQP